MNDWRIHLAILFSIATAPLGRAELKSYDTDLLVVGATESGWAAAIQAARMGVKAITVVHDGTWYGGQYTEQALVCVDENKGVGKVGWGVDWHPMKRSFHRSGLFKELMDRIEAFNLEKYGDPMPGRPFHGPSTHRPAEAEAVFRELIQPYVDSGQVRVIWKHYPVSAELDRTNPDHPRLTSLTFAPVDLQTGRGGEPDFKVTAAMTIDASDWGDAIQVSGTAYECGPDPRSRYGEPSAPEDLSDFPHNEMNPITWPMIVAESDGDTSIPKPPNYDDRYFVRATILGRPELGNFKWDRPARMGGIPHWPPGGAAKTSPRQLTIFTVRRIVDGYASKDGKTSILLNYTNGQDYPLERLPKRVADALEANERGALQKNIVEMTREQRQIIFDDTKQHSLRLFYHLQNFVHERADDRTNSFRHFHLSGEFGTPDNLPPKPYIRESLRLKA
ncbi:MAG: FAD-dependent oxidoreductase, partial [Verrucomicrobiae bacterium]|nr:FAD-dependent oxidoreductase [Verrucomicrobiae bacterium]